MPLITITDPNRPAPVSDIVGDDRGPKGSLRWQLTRPSARQLQVLAAIVVLLAVALPSAVVLRQRQHEQNLDRVALADLRLSAAPDDVPTDVVGGTARLTLLNDGHQRVTVVGARVDREHYADQMFHVFVDPGGSALLTLGPDVACPKSASQSSPTGVLVTILTARHQRRTVRIPVGNSFFAATYQSLLERACGLLSPGESLQVDLVSQVLKGEHVEVVLDVRNDAALARTLTSMTAGDGFDVSTSPALPLQMAPGAASPRRLTGTVSVSSCPSARQLAGPSDGALLGDLLLGVTGDGGDAVSAAYLGDPFGVALRQLVRRAC